ncbi:MAG: hypothetical protein EU552_00520 [Promethearchaeota archaeon]|jgi:predicted RecB family nuclease|nr:MAG: hypothetical protein EU552_00520 [Candidatus Lokiarchaeota archaeon]
MSKNLTLLQDVDAELSRKLKDLDILTIEMLANTDFQMLEQIEGIDHDKAEELVAQAYEYLKQNDVPLTAKGKKITSKYSMKTTLKREIEENEEK